MARLTMGPAAWTRPERVLVESSAGEVSTFTYDSGVEALRVVTDQAEAVVLPFQGQQVWRLTLAGEPVTMRTMWDDPVPTSVFAHSYGCFLMHCGLTYMGAPGPGESGNHGELPCASYASCVVEVDEAARTIAVSGTYQHRQSHSYGYRFTPRATFRAGVAGMEVDATIENTRHTPLSWMYLAHVNWAYWPGARMEQDVREDTHPFPGGRLPDGAVDPEVVSIITPDPDGHGWSHASMVRDDGLRATVSYDTAELPRTVRWVSRTEDEQAAGFCMPATGHHLGRARSEADGLVRSLAGRSAVTVRLRVGLES